MKKRSIKLLALLMTCTLTVTPMTALASDTQTTGVAVSEAAIDSLEAVGEGINEDGISIVGNDDGDDQSGNGEGGNTGGGDTSQGSDGNEGEGSEDGDNKGEGSEDGDNKGEGNEGEGSEDGDNKGEGNEGEGSEDGDNKGEGNEGEGSEDGDNKGEGSEGEGSEDGDNKGEGSEGEGSEDGDNKGEGNEKTNPTVKLENKTVTYNGKAQTIDSAFVTGSNGKVAYKYYSDANCTKEIAAANVINAGTYYVKATVEETADSNAATSAAATLTINKADSSITLANKTVTYDGKAQTIGSASVTGSNGTVTYKYYSDAACTKEVTAANVKNAGTYYVKATVAAATNYNAATSTAAKLTINKAASKATLANKTVTYNGKAQTIGSASVTGSTGAVTYKYYSDSACKKAVTAANVKKAGTYYVKATVAANTNYNAATSAAAKLTISKAASKVTLKNVTVTATGKKIAMTGAKATGSSGKITYKYYSDKACKKAVSASNVKKAGTYYVKATVAADTNYKSATSSAAKLVIKPAQTFTYKKTTVTYKASALKSAKKTFKIGAASKQKGKITYTKASNAKKTLSVSKTGTVTVKKGLKKGTYTLSVKITAAAKGSYGKTTVTKTIKVKVK